MKAKIIAHRGASAYAPENTIPSFKKAIEMEADAIELDIHLSKDDYLMVCHDKVISRTSNGKGVIKDFTLRELKELDFGSWFGEEFAGTTIPTLEEVLELFKDWNGLLNIEIKGGGNYYPGIEEKVMDVINKYNFTERVLFSSFDHYSLKEIKKIDPEIKIGLLYGEKLFRPWEYASIMGAEALHPSFNTVDKEIVEGCKRKGILLHPWTINDENQMKTMIEYGIEGLITNKPDVAKKIRDI